MNSRSKRLPCIVHALITFVAAGFADVSFGDPATMDLAATSLQDQGSPLRQSLQVYDLNLQGFVGDRWNWRGNVASSQIFFQPGITSESRMQQNQYLSSIGVNQYSDLLHGIITWQPTWIRITGNDYLGLTQGQIGAMAWKFTPYNKPFDLSLDFSAAHYASGITARQWHAGSDIFSDHRANIFRIDLDCQQVIEGENRHFSSIALSYQHLFNLDWAILPYSMGVSVQAGTEQYDVDTTLASIDNFADVKHGTLRASARWLLGSQFDLGIQLSDSRYQSFSSTNRYQTPAITVDLAHPW